jgi:hypothetical protein
MTLDPDFHGIRSLGVAVQADTSFLVMSALDAGISRSPRLRSGLGQITGSGACGGRGESVLGKGRSAAEHVDGCAG